MALTGSTPSPLTGSSGSATVATARRLSHVFPFTPAPARAGISVYPAAAADEACGSAARL
ncbi:hypothetical protein FO488_01255 [Geobacter sp. FeAm09]|uniref:hypothetical protein n=1 Tax=Geobacter sp. FeAm09 TaxID=2597769 RepID=UPI0011EC8151|nr:hypothetical protein [Geobacter sp. FeAm09]QEM66922.1 hypothetical protein FO488_01255 [Geobacter sp. FeAm09]